MNKFLKAGQLFNLHQEVFDTEVEVILAKFSEEIKNAVPGKTKKTSEGEA